MTLPREVIPGRFYMVTRRCTQRQLLLRPNPETNNAFIYCLADAAQRFDIDVLLPSAMSNHHHTVIYDRHGTLPIGRPGSAIAPSSIVAPCRPPALWISAIRMAAPCAIRMAAR